MGLLSCISAGCGWAIMIALLSNFFVPAILLMAAIAFARSVFRKLLK